MEFSVDKVAKLAYVSLTQEQKKTFKAQFEDILKYVDQLNEVPIKPEEAKDMGKFHVQTAFYKALGLDPSQTLREEAKNEDLNQTNLTNEEALQNAPKTGGLPGELMYEVPSIIERG